ncbi:MAG TPA: sensor histidine kinase [Micromonosporaceae bacterium]|nr:sensor histidine kinase [Micromonosporaceae bacterium]
MATWRWLYSRPVAGDAALAAGLLAAQAVLLLLGPRELWPGSWAGALAGAAVGLSPIAIRRRHLEWAVAACVVLMVVWIPIRYLDPISLTIIVLTYTAAASRQLQRAAPLAATLWLATVAVQLAQRGRLAGAGINVWYAMTADVLIALVAFFIGRTVHNRRAYTAALEERTRAAEENLRSLAGQAVADERRRIARELHDVVAHHVSVMGVLATGARRVLSRDPASADEALDTIEKTGRTVLREMRRLLTVLRTEAEPAAELAPQPGLAGIETLIEQVREAGLPVALRVEGEPSPLDPGVALTVYRIVQEALTNSLKHAGTATAGVRLDFGRQWLLLEVFDTGRGPRLAPAPLGHGLLGMRERVALYGGTLRTGPRPGGGFRVYAKIPMDQLDGTGPRQDT